MNIASCRRTLLLAVSIILGFGISTAQNLINNGGFESVNVIPRFKTGDVIHNWNSQMYPTGWFMPTLGTPDVISNNYNTCDYSYTPTPNACYPQVCYADNIYGCQNLRVAYNSNNQPIPNYVYMGFTTCGTSTSYTPNDFREYLETELAPVNGLVAGQCYVLTFYVSRADMSSRAVPIQAALTRDPLVNTSSTFAGPLTVPSDAIFLETHQTYEDKLGWSMITFPFIATGGEKYLTIGFFEDETSSKIQTSYGSTTCSNTSCMSNTDYLNGNNHTGYYYIDDIALYATANPQFTNATSYSNTSLSGSYTGNIILNGAITISNNTTFTNCTIKCTSGTTITVLGTKTLEIDNTSISAGCDHMWNGIVGNTFSFIKVKNNSSISDAYTAIDCQSGYIEIDKSSFLANENDLKIRQPIATSYVKGSTFDHTMQLKEATRGVNGYGITAIDFGDYTGTFPIGGPNTTDICYFHGGQYGVVSNNANLTIERCYFDGIKERAIDFQGNGSNNSIRSLSVTSTTLINNKRHIVSKHRTNLTVQYSALSYAQEHAIEWEDNHDCHLTIGDENTAQAGNTFYNNGWTAITAVDNKTLYTGVNQDLAALQTTDYTTITIANNQITAPAYAGGILLGEWTLGGGASYYSLYIKNNTFTNMVKGIQMYNVEGWNGTFGSNPPPNPPPQTVNSNMIYTTTAQVQNPVGIKLGNTWGFDVTENGVSSDNTGNYNNNGLIFENAPFTEISENILSAGTCISTAADMIGSNIHCNILANYAVGINLGWTYLRTGSSDLHGSSQEEFNNATNAGIPWNEDIAVYNSQVGHNQWVWNYANSFLTITYSGNTGSGSIISSVTGVDKCNTILSPVYVQGSDNTHMIFSNNPTAQWRADYNYEIRRLHTGIGDSTIASANIKAIISIETQISDGDYAGALAALAAFSPSNAIEQNYQTVLAIMANVSYPTKRDATAAEKNALIAIAEQHARTAGAAVTIARAYLAANYNLYFDDESFNEGEVTGVAEIRTPCSLAPASATELDMMDENGNALGITGSVIETDGGFSIDPQQLAYYYQQDTSATYRIYAKNGSQFTVVNKDFHTIAEWIALSPISLDLSGVSVAEDTLTASEYMQIDAYLTLADAQGNTYAVGTTGSSPNTDMYIEKRDANSTLLWTRSWDGPVSGNDTATCMYLDDDANIYVAGKVWNGRSYDYQALKYDTDGYLVWSSMLADNEGCNNTPSGITVDPADGSVHITGMHSCSRSSAYRYVKYWQCLPSANRTGQSAQSEQMATESAAERLIIYPNPTSGQVYVDIRTLGAGVIILTDIAGQTVFSAQITGSSPLEIPETVADGIYFITFTATDNSSRVEKLILKRDK